MLLGIVFVSLENDAFLIPFLSARAQAKAEGDPDRGRG